MQPGAINNQPAVRAKLRHSINCGVRVVKRQHAHVPDDVGVGELRYGCGNCTDDNRQKRQRRREKYAHAIPQGIANLRPKIHRDLSKTQLDD